ncbi:hypothetical protein SKAU_G00035980 [Synaphobranchus kaupii]|uniref:Uncharacterized protein n=1 Tax=Synaphobranchus kaupii TaxID=118154 RepID=A0A9Q1GES6_SYNKA|nr:hypothetical protein SKAU_G00035980 [Synaphobranchus kaupii]
MLAMSNHSETAHSSGTGGEGRGRPPTSFKIHSAPLRILPEASSFRSPSTLKAGGYFLIPSGAMEQGVVLAGDRSPQRGRARRVYDRRR